VSHPIDEPDEECVMQTCLEGIDLSKLKQLMDETVGSIRRLKSVLRAPWLRPMAVEQRDLCQLKQKATLLYILRASLRGRCHLSRLPDPSLDRAAYHAEMARRAADRYGVFVEVTP
jgi:hypothetical protein